MVDEGRGVGGAGRAILISASCVMLSSDLPSFQTLEKSPGKGTPTPTASLQTHFLQGSCSSSSYYTWDKKSVLIGLAPARCQPGARHRSQSYLGWCGTVGSSLEPGRPGANPSTGTSYQSDPVDHGPLLSLVALICKLGVSGPGFPGLLS